MSHDRVSAFLGLARQLSRLMIVGLISSDKSLLSHPGFCPFRPLDSP